MALHLCQSVGVRMSRTIGVQTLAGVHAHAVWGDGREGADQGLLSQGRRGLVLTLSPRCQEATTLRDVRTGLPVPAGV